MQLFSYMYMYTKAAYKFIPELRTWMPNIAFCMPQIFMHTKYLFKKRPTYLLYTVYMLRKSK